LQHDPFAATERAIQFHFLSAIRSDDLVLLRIEDAAEPKLTLRRHAGGNGRRSLGQDSAEEIGEYEIVSGGRTELAHVGLTPANQRLREIERFILPRGSHRIGIEVGRRDFPRAAEPGRQGENTAAGSKIEHGHFAQVLPVHQRPQEHESRGMFAAAEGEAVRDMELRTPGGSTAPRFFVDDLQLAPDPGGRRGARSGPFPDIDGTTARAREST